MGAKIVGDLSRCGSVSKKEAMRLLSFCSTSGPVFMISAVGIGMLGSKGAGLVIAISHYSAALLNGVVYSWIMGFGEIKLNKNVCCEINLMEQLTKSIFAAFKSMGVILAYIIFFMFMMDLIDTAGFFEIFRSKSINCLLHGFLEMTVGCSVTSEELNEYQACIITSMIISWGGMSILGQSMSMLTGTGISAGYVMLTKLSHSIFAGIIALFIGKLMI